MKEYMLAVLLEQKAPGEEFGRWPLHITLVPWFQLKGSIEKLTQDIQSAVSSFQAFAAKVGPRKQWGTHTVHLIDDPVVHELHKRLLEVVKKHGKLTAPIRLTGKQYRPHITQKPYATVQRGFQVHVKQIYLIEAPKKNPLIRLKKVTAVGVLN